MDLVQGVTSDHQLIKLATIIDVHLDDIIDFRDIKAPLKRGSYISLLRSDNDVGHWVAVHNDEYFDSTGVGPPTVLGVLKYNEVQYQSTYAEYCGIWALLWLYSKQHNKSELFHDMTNLDIDILRA